MIMPIQQNVVFKGVENSSSKNNEFTGSMNSARSVRGDYAAAVQNVLNIQQSTMAKNDAHTGKKIDTIT